MNFENPEDAIDRQLEGVRALIRIAEAMPYDSEERASLCMKIDVILAHMEQAQALLLQSRGITHNVLYIH